MRCGRPKAGGGCAVTFPEAADRMHSAREVPKRIEDRVIVALDVPSIKEARVLVDKLDAVVSLFKIGLWL